MSPLDKLLDAMAGTPAFPGARCRGQHELFDAVTDEQIAEAVRTCQSCPALGPCSTWADSLADNDVHGVVAGRLFRWAAVPPSLRLERRQARAAMQGGKQ